MSALAQHLDEYLELRRSLGHKLADAHRVLPWFVSYLDDPTSAVRRHLEGVCDCVSPGNHWFGGAAELKTCRHTTS